MVNESRRHTEEWTLQFSRIGNRLDQLAAPRTVSDSVRAKASPFCLSQALPGLVTLLVTILQSDLLGGSSGIIPNRGAV